MVSASRMIAFSLAFVKGSSLVVTDTSTVVQAKPHVNLARQAVQAEEDVVISSELEDIDDTRMEYIRAGVATLKKLKTVSNIMKVLTGQNSYANMMPVFQQAFKTEKFISTLAEVSRVLTRNATEGQRNVEMSADQLKKDVKKLETDEEVIKLLQNFYEDQRQLTLQTADGLQSAFGALAASLPKKTLEKVEPNLKYVVGAMRGPLSGVASLYEKFINGKPEHACRDLGYMLRNTTVKKDSFVGTLQELELTTKAMPIVLKGVTPTESLENVTKTVTGFVSACHAVYRYFDHTDASILTQVGGITHKRLKCDWKQDGSVEGETHKKEKALKPEDMST